MAEPGTRKKRGLFISDDIYDDFSKLSTEKGTSINDLVERAMRLYRDVEYMNEKADVLPELLLRAIQSEIVLSEQRTSNRLNPLLSTIALNLYMICAAISQTLEISSSDLETLRIKAVNDLQSGNKIFKFDDFYKRG